MKGFLELAALWTTFNGDAIMTIYLLIYIIGHLLSTVLIGFMLGRLRLVQLLIARLACWRRRDPKKEENTRGVPAPEGSVEHK